MCDAIFCSDGSLMISDASVDDVGVFECVATSDGQEIKSRPARIRYYRPRAKPAIIHRYHVEPSINDAINNLVISNPRPSRSLH